METRKIESNEVPWGINLNTANALKGVACIFILMGHYGTAQYNLGNKPIGFSWFIWKTTANIALVLFMYFSGYGLSLKNNDVNIFAVLIKRLKKVYLPLLFVAIITMMTYILLPDRYSLEDLSKIWASDLYYIHHCSYHDIPHLILSALGWPDWYVFCIMIFYSLFYLSKYVSQKIAISQTIVLWYLFIAYFIIAYFYFGPPEAHWYRFCWVFFGAHLHAIWKDLSISVKKVYSMLFVVIALTMIIESKWMIISYMIAVIGITLFTFLNRRFTIQSPILAFLASISYFFYLSHIRIGYQLMTYTNIESVLFWVILTCAISFILKKAYSKFVI